MVIVVRGSIERLSLLVIREEHSFVTWLAAAAASKHTVATMSSSEPATCCDCDAQSKI